MSFIGGLLSSKTKPEDVENFVKSPGLQNNPFSDRYQAQAGNFSGQANNGAQAMTALQQQDLINMLQRRATGQAPSLTEQILKQSLDRNAANTNGLMASVRGSVNPALLARNALRQNSDMTQQAAGQAVLGRQNEQMNAENMLGQTLSGVRAQDMQNSNMFNQLSQNAEGMGLQAAGANLTGNLQSNNINAGIATGNTKAQNTATGGVINGLGAVLASVAGKSAPATKMNQGGMIPGQAKVSGDSPQNDTVSTKLSPGEIVIPRSKAQDPEKAKAFIDHVLKSKVKHHQDEGYTKILKELQALKKIRNK